MEMRLSLGHQIFYVSDKPQFDAKITTHLKLGLCHLDTVLMNFDGWNFIKYPYYDWVRTNGIYATTIVSGLRITFPRTTLVGTERAPITKQKVRIKNIILF